MKAMKVAFIQFLTDKNPEYKYADRANTDRAEMMVRNTVATGVNVIILPELFETRLFCQMADDPKFFAWSETIVSRFSVLAGELGVVISIPFFEKEGDEYFNSCAVADADGKIVGVYRKHPVPISKCYEEEHKFSPGYKVFDTKFGKIGMATCWDRWTPLAGDSTIALTGADLVVYSYVTFNIQ